MAQALAHKLGQMIGEFIESHVTNLLMTVSDPRGLYLDIVGRQRPARNSKKVTWVDIYGSKHDLDFVIERDGTDKEIGIPVALIECAWRRYTKHSKNKAQEIQGAILPIAEKYKSEKPFLGVILAGEFTAPSITQLESCGFCKIYFTYDVIVSAFKSFDIDISFDEETPDIDVEQKIKSFNTLTPENLNIIFEYIVSSSKNEVTKFIQNLELSLDRTVKNIIISPMFGTHESFETVEEAILFIGSFNVESAPENIKFIRFFIQAEYTNGDKISGDFNSIANATYFLEKIIK